MSFVGFSSFFFFVAFASFDFSYLVYSRTWLFSVRGRIVILNEKYLKRLEGGMMMILHNPPSRSLSLSVSFCLYWFEELYRVYLFIYLFFIWRTMACPSVQPCFDSAALI